MINQLPFRKEVAALQGVKLVTEVNFSGYIRSVLIHWPGGCNALVEVRVGLRGEQIVPTESGEFVALDDATIMFPPSPMMFDKQIVGGERIWVEIKNGDNSNAHTISVIVFIEEAK